jgi:two-component sensor histidine kinase
LSDQHGPVDVTWQVRSEPHDVLHLEWAETGGPAVRAPEREGFGTRMLHRVLAAQTDAKVSMNYQPTGLQVILELPLSAPAAGSYRLKQ